MKVNEIVEFKKTKNRYRIAGFGKMKDPKSKKWLDSVVYENFQDYVEEIGYTAPKEVSIFTREKSDFEDKFEPSVPKIQILKEDRSYIYDFGLPENVLIKYFDLGLGMRNGVHYSEELGDLPTFCQLLAGDIMIAGMIEADERVSQAFLDTINADIANGVFKKSAKGLIELQNLLYFLSVPGIPPVQETGEDAKGEAPVQKKVEEDDEQQ